MTQPIPRYIYQLSSTSYPHCRIEYTLLALLHVPSPADYTSHTVIKTPPYAAVLTIGNVVTSVQGA